uniref:uncharacterized protein hemgn isoform X2 n=1 Tax=Monopterus albus TaxID=43700 RepID=UPI0009B3BEE5|nr:hemogen isoform X2 [Monopterus albus]
MEGILQQEKQESEYKNPNEDEGGIRCRLRDRNLLRKRKAEAEEKETNQWVWGVESQRKRSVAGEKSGTRKRGRPRKTEPTAERSVIQEEAAVLQESPAVVVVSEPAGAIPDHTSGSFSPLIAVGGDTLVSRQPASLLAGSVFASGLTSPAPLNPTPALVSSLIPVPFPAQILDTAPVPAPVAVPVPGLSQVSVPAGAPAPPTVFPLVETLYTDSQGREALDQVLIEDLGADEEEDISPSQDKGAAEDMSETPSIGVPEQSKMFSVSTVFSPPEEYLSGN